MEQTKGPERLFAVKLVWTDFESHPNCKAVCIRCQGRGCDVCGVGVTGSKGGPKGGDNDTNRGCQYCGNTGCVKCGVTNCYSCGDYGCDKCGRGSDGDEADWSGANTKRGFFACEYCDGAGCWHCNMIW